MQDDRALDEYGCISREKYQALEAEVQRLTDELAECQEALDREVEGSKRIRWAHRLLADFLARIPGQVAVMDAHNEGPSAAAIRIITERDATIAEASVLLDSYGVTWPFPVATEGQELGGL